MVVVILMWVMVLLIMCVINGPVTSRVPTTQTSSRCQCGIISAMGRYLLIRVLVGRRGSCSNAAGTGIIINIFCTFVLRGVRSTRRMWTSPPVSISMSIPTRMRCIRINRILGLPSPYKTIGITKGSLEKGTLCRDTLQGTSRSSQRVHRPIMW